MSQNFPDRKRKLLQICKTGQANPTGRSTAYGSAVEVPRDLDILIAGSSCTDYSGLNNYQKEYGEEGQSMSTFQGVLGYAKRHKPRIVLLENVYKAPWKDLRTEFENVGYTTFVSKVDTKDFYIPQTRMRGYMIGFNREFATTAGLDLANIATDWANFFEAYSRRASSPFTDFIYSEEDPWLDQIRRELIISQSLEKPRRKVDWLHCRHRYISFRAAYGLGFRKPVTMWENNGTCKFPDGSWLKWAKGQVERIWDTIDINHLRCVAQRDYDNRWKM
jgi:site-specific DNA-cytosine methylase